MPKFYVCPGKLHVCSSKLRARGQKFHARLGKLRACRWKLRALVGSFMRALELSCALLEASRVQVDAFPFHVFNIRDAS